MSHRYDDDEKTRAGSGLTRFVEKDPRLAATVFGDQSIEHNPMLWSKRKAETTVISSDDPGR